MPNLVWILYSMFYEEKNHFFFSSGNTDFHTLDLLKVRQTSGHCLHCSVDDSRAESSLKAEAEPKEAT